MSVNRILVIAPLFLAGLAAAAPRVPAPDGGAATFEPALEAESLPAPDSLRVIVRCDSCDGSQGATLSFLWRAEQSDDGIEHSRALRPADWAGGVFELAGADLAAPLRIVGEALPAPAIGFRVDVPLFGRPLPFRVVGGAPGFVAGRAAWWPERDGAAPLTLELQPTRELLEAHPAWDPDMTEECDILLPKDSAGTATFFRNGQPWAWLFSRQGRDGAESSWSFQFVRPGGNLLERVQVDVNASDEGDSWGFRLPLAALVPLQPAGTTSKQASASTWEERPENSLVDVSAGDAFMGAIVLGDCPRNIE